MKMGEEEREAGRVMDSIAVKRKSQGGKHKRP